MSFLKYGFGFCRRIVRKIFVFLSIPDGANLAEGSFFDWPIYWPVGDGLHIGKGCVFGPDCRLIIMKKSPQCSLANGMIIIGENVRVTHGLQIHSACKVTISNGCLFAANVFISDCTHGTYSAAIPYHEQQYVAFSPVEIGAGAWLGQNVVVLPGAKIGQACVIGANSVVKGVIPDFHMAAGAPARLIKRWDHIENRWVEIKTT